jgi:hypothetical protein
MMNMAITVINGRQYDSCLELRNHLIEVREQKTELAGMYYANQMDRLGVPWDIQNRISASIEDRRNDHIQLHVLLELDVISG